MPTKAEIDRFKREGEYPRVTDNFLRYRQLDPSRCEPDSYATIDTPSGVQLIRCKDKRTGQTVTQSILRPKRGKSKTT